jgi:hypothetical protein
VPSSVTSASHFFGVAAFSVGIPPVAFFIQSSMAQPQQFAAALRVALWLVWAAYVVVSQRLRHCLRQSQLKSNCTYLCSVVLNTRAAKCIRNIETASYYVVPLNLSQQ